MYALSLGSSVGCLRGREMRKREYRVWATQSLLTVTTDPEGRAGGGGGERGGKTRLTALTLLHISSYLYDQWGGGRGRAGWNPGAELTATPVLSPPLSLSVLFSHCPSLSLISPRSGSSGLRLFISLSHVPSLSLSALWSSIPPGVSLSLPLSSPHGSLHPPWLPPASLP